MLGWYDDGEVKYGIEIPRLLSLLAYHDPNATVEGLDTIPRTQPPVNVVRFAFQTMVGIGVGARAARRRSTSRLAPAPAAAALGVVLPRGRRRRPALGRGADRGLDHDRGRPPAVGRLRRDAHLGGGDGRERDPVGYATLALVYAGLAVAVCWMLRRLSRAPLELARGCSLADVPLILMLVGRPPTRCSAAPTSAPASGSSSAAAASAHRQMREHAHHSMGPVWEANHVWLIFVLVVCWTAYPSAFGSITSTLAVPLFIAADRNHPARHGVRAAVRGRRARASSGRSRPCSAARRS